ncbi:hypothetical protein Tco_0846159 [Tanacetum coccineum]
MVEYMRVLATRRHVSIRSFDVNAATRLQVGHGHFQQSRLAVSFLTDDWTCRIKRWCGPRSRTKGGLERITKKRTKKLKAQNDNTRSRKVNQVKKSTEKSTGQSQSQPKSTPRPKDKEIQV